MNLPHFENATQLLQDELAQRKQRNPRYSLRAFAQNLSISPAQLSQLLSGKRTYTPEMVSQIAKGLHLSPEQERYLLTQTILGKSQPLPSEVDKRQLIEDEFRLISDWYHFAILSLSKIKNAKTDPFWISDRLGITVVEAREALDRLRRLKIIDDGKVLKQIAAPLNAASEVPSRAIQGYHHQVLNMAMEKLPVTPLNKRDYSAITFAADATKIPEARKMIESFQDRLSEFLQTPNAKEVFIMSCQLFSLERNSL
ncbi:MAG: TIGR02147 family protein [Bdellovibrio sp.]|nr:TIGR02147 family protein [Bdellovibrio sp.]